MITFALNEYGLREKDMEYMLHLFRDNREIERVVLFGSRAMKSYEMGSDIDLALFGSTITPSIVAHIHDLLENESPTLLHFDLLHFENTTNIDLKTNIEKYGIEIYIRN